MSTNTGTLDVTATLKNDQAIINAIRNVYKTGSHDVVMFSLEHARTREEAGNLFDQLEPYGTMSYCGRTGWCRIVKNKL
jgi:hypothetical protein